MDMVWIKSAIIVTVLLGCSYYDVKEKRVPLAWILAGMAAILIANMIGKDMGISACLIGMTLGAVLVAVSKWSKEALGIGDALLILMIGMGMGIYQTALVVFYALFVTSVVCAVLLMMKRVGKKTRIPFVPFLLLGYVGVILSWQV